MIYLRISNIEPIVNNDKLTSYEEAMSCVENGDKVMHLGLDIDGLCNPVQRRDYDVYETFPNLSSLVLRGTTYDFNSTIDYRIYTMISRCV